MSEERRIEFSLPLDAPWEGIRRAMDKILHGTAKALDTLSTEQVEDILNRAHSESLGKDPIKGWALMMVIGACQSILHTRISKSLAE